MLNLFSVKQLHKIKFNFHWFLNLIFLVDKNENWIEDVDNRVCLAIKRVWEKKIIESGDTVVLVTGWREGSGHTNTVRILVVPEGDEPPKRLYYC